MKVNTILSLLTLASGSFASRGNQYSTYDEGEPLDLRSRVTAFVNTEDGLKVECWAIGDLLPDNYVTRADGSKGRVRQTNMASVIGGITLFSFAPSVTIFSFGTSEIHENAVDFRNKPNLFTVKDGLIFIEAQPVNDAAISGSSDRSQYVFADVNGDDWFYFEDTIPSDSDYEENTSRKDSQCARSKSNPLTQSTFNVRTISGSDTTLINFEYERTPSHTVLHEGRCNFAGLKPVKPSKSRHFRKQEMK